MKSVKIYLLALTAMAAASCDDFIDVRPTGVVDGELAYSQPDKIDRKSVV